MAIEKDFDKTYPAQMARATIACPFCGESFEVLLDDTEGEQSLITDCEICCRPMAVTAKISGGELQWSNVGAE
jgi:hypothetical protein